jgi:hypothetical protein
MFKRRTLFVVGAGASVDAGLPLGRRLAEIIAAKLKFEIDSFGRPKSAGDNELVGQFVHQHQKNLGPCIAAFRTIRKGVLLSNSIDDFLNIHNSDERIVEFGKATIVRTILEAEKKSKLFVDPQRAHAPLDFTKIDGSWYLKFVRLLGPGTTPAKIAEAFKTVSFIVFNYDRCIEHVLAHAIETLYAIPHDEAKKIVDEIDILHPYGSIGPLERLPFGGNEHLTYNYLHLSKGIKTYTEQVEDTGIATSMAALIKDAARIVFLGFAYHDQNMALLKPKRKLYGKEILGTAFKMSDADVSEVKSQLVEFFPPERERTEFAAIETDYHVNVENKLDCASLFDYYAKRIAA